MSRKRRRTNKPQSNSMLEQRNFVRGLIAASKSSEVIISKGKNKGEDQSDRANKFQRSLAAILINARKSLGTSQFDGFLSWLEIQTSHQTTPMKNFGALNSDLVQEVLASHPLPLHNEILWIVSRLVQHKDQLTKFIHEKDKLEDLYWTGDWVKIEEQLALIKIHFGRTLWNLEVFISLEQEFVGLEAQKKIASAERKVAPRSLAAYLAYYISVRNEPATVLSRHFEEVSSRIDRLDVSSALKSFLKYRLLDRYPVSEEEAGHVLQVAQSLAEVDLYESLIGICQALALRKQEFSLVHAVRKGLERLRCIGDERIEAVLSVFTESASQNNSSEKNISINPPSLKEALNRLKQNPREAQTAIQAAAQLNTVRKLTVDNVSGPRWPIVIRQIASVLRFDPSYDSDLNVVERYFCNHHYFATATVCLHLLKAEMSVVCEEAVQNRYRAMICRRIDLYPCTADAVHHRILLDSEVFARKEQLRWVKVLTILTELQAAISDGELGTVVTQLAHLYLNNIIPLSALPLQSGIGNIRWRQLKRYRDRLALSISLHLCWRTTDSDLAATNLRFAYEEFLEAHNIEAPSDIINLRDKFGFNEIIYFLNNVCVANVMDMSQKIKSSRGAEEERQKVCAALCEIDPDNRVYYEAEIVNIVHSLSVQEGRTVVDSSRVHVDTGAIRAWAARELESSFSRYAALVYAGVGKAENFDDLIRNIRNVDSQSYLAVPESEADDVLVEMIVEIREQFLIDPRHGLDSYLSRRVRHHSMTGYLRGPVEEEQLITSRSTKTSRYAANTYWINRLGAITPGEISRISNCFEEFAVDFDKIILNLKNELFHVNNSEHPNGLFEIPITAPMIHLARSAVQIDMSLDGFCNICFSLFWASLDSSLRNAQRKLSNDTKRNLSAAFQRLRSSLRKSVHDRERYDDASVIIWKAAENVQRGIDKMVEWFMRREIQQTNIQYSIEKVLEIAIESALTSHRPFNPLITTKVKCEYHVRATDLIVIAEIILTALGNAKAYGGGSKRPKVDISAHCAGNEDILILRIENDVDPSVLTTESVKRIDRIRSQIKDGSYVDKIRSEGGTGLMKIAGTASQSKNGQIEFDFMGENRFFVEIMLSFVREDSETSDIVVGRLVE